MPPPSLPALSGLAALLLAACGAGPVAVPQLTLIPGVDSVVVPFAEATEAAWLGGDRWAVLLPGGPEAGIVNFASRSHTTLGTKATLENPFSLFRAGDTLYAGEPLKRRLTLWTLDGGFARNEPASDLVRGALPRARDGAGLFYAELRPAAGADGSGNRDSAVVVKLNGAGVDTVARLAPLDLAKVASPTGERFERRVFSGVDRWGVYSDGTMWLARVYHNRVDFRRPDGKTMKGEPLPDRVLEVTRADRDLFVRKFPEELRGTAEQLPFAPIKAAFTSAFADANGRIWLEGSRSVSDSLQRYNVVGRDGRLLFVILLPGTGRAIAASATQVLVADLMRDGMRLRLAPMPVVPSTSSDTTK
jgi:hypothetical protein